MSRGETGSAFVTTRSRMMKGWFTLSSSLRAYDQLTARAIPMVTAAVVANRVRACQRRVFFTTFLDAAEVQRFDAQRGSKICVHSLAESTSTSGGADSRVCGASP